MPTFKINNYEIYCTSYQLDAATWEEAVKGFVDGTIDATAYDCGPDFIENMEGQVFQLGDNVFEMEDDGQNAREVNNHG